jgi:hypothetical protein
MANPGYQKRRAFIQHQKVSSQKIRQITRIAFYNLGKYKWRRNIKEDGALTNDDYDSM